MGRVANVLFGSLFVQLLTTFGLFSMATAENEEAIQKLSKAIAAIDGLKHSLANARTKIDLANGAFSGDGKTKEESAKSYVYNLFDQLISFLDVFEENYSFGREQYRQNNPQAGQQFGSPNGRRRR